MSKRGYNIFSQECQWPLINTHSSELDSSKV